MANLRRTAMGEAVDMDLLRLANENTIAIGNAKTNARGDLLGPGGKVIKTRAQMMQDYHKTNVQFASHDDFIEDLAPVSETVAQPATNVLQGTAQDLPLDEFTSTNYVKPRGSFAESVAEETEVKQELVEPAKNTPKGIQRI